MLCLIASFYNGAGRFGDCVFFYGGIFVDWDDY